MGQITMPSIWDSAQKDDYWRGGRVPLKLRKSSGLFVGAATRILKNGVVLRVGQTDHVLDKERVACLLLRCHRWAAAKKLISPPDFRSIWGFARHTCVAGRRPVVISPTTYRALVRWGRVPKPDDLDERVNPDAGL